MPDDTPQQQLLRQMSQVLKRFGAEDELQPIEDRGAWDELVELQSPEDRELLEELSRFVDLWRYFQARQEKLGPEIVQSVGELHNLPIADRKLRLRDINQKLMERVTSVGQDPQFRQ